MLGPIRRTGFFGVAVAIALIVIAIAVLRAGVSSSLSTPAKALPAARYGGLPKWLPKVSPTSAAGISAASPTHQVLALQGETVSVELGAGSQVLATAVGPSVPEDGRFPVPATSPCTFILTLAHASRAIPISAAAFTLIDEGGHVRHPRVTALDGGPAPSEVLPGHVLSLKIYDVIPTGDGGLAWAPNGERHPLVAWDFDVEID